MLLTQQVADSVLGAGAEKSAANNVVSSDDVNVSTCTYSSQHDGTITGIKNMKTATILVRAPLSDAGERSNKQPFDPQKSGTQTVDGYGEMAFWDPEFGQLNVYKNGTWLITTFGKGTPSENSLDDAKKLTNKIVLAL